MWNDITLFGSVIRTCLDRYNTAFWCHMHSVQKHVANTHTPSSLCSLGNLLSLFFFSLVLSCSFSINLFFSVSFFESLTSATVPPPFLHLDWVYALAPSSQMDQVSYLELQVCSCSPCRTTKLILHNQLEGTITHVPFRFQAGLTVCVLFKIFHLVKTYSECVSLWLCVFVCVIVRSYMKSVVPCSLVTPHCLL